MIAVTNEQIVFLKSLANNVGNNACDVNWDDVFKIALQHNILPLCYENACSAEGFEKEKFAQIRQKVFAAVCAQAKRTHNFGKIYKTIANDGIEPIVLKGIICRNLYGEFCDHRPSGDEDILVKKEDYFKLEALLKENGYVPSETLDEKMLMGKQEVTFKNANGLNIEVHLNIIGTENKLRRKMNSFFDNAFDNSVVVTANGINYRTLDYTEHYIYLFYHMFKHFSLTGVGVRQMLDLFKFGDCYREKIDFDTVNEAVRAIGAGKLYGDMICIADTYWDLKFENVFGVSFPERLLEDMFCAGAYGNGTSERMGSKVKLMAALDGKKGKINMIFPSITFMREHYTVLYRHPYLLPVMWIVRIVRYVFRLNTGKTYDVLKSEKIADQKIELLKDYEII